MGVYIILSFCNQLEPLIWIKNETSCNAERVQIERVSRYKICSVQRETEQKFCTNKQKTEWQKTNKN